MVLSRLTKITGPGVSTDTNWVGNNADFTGITTTATSFNIGVTTIHSTLIESHNIVSTGVVTAISFSGDGSGLTGVANTDFVVGTAITMGTANFTGNVTIGGTLTYEDVTNIDSVGIVTGAAGDFDDFLDVGSNIKLGNAGVVTATSFVGSGAQLTDITQSDTPLASSTASTVFYESDDETTVSTDTTLTRTSSNSGVIYTKFQQVVVAPTKSLIVDTGETLVVDAYGLRTPDI
jgi:hypothetical protein